MNSVPPAAHGRVWGTVGFIGLVVAAVVSFFWALLPIGSTSLLAYELSRFTFAAIIFGRLAFVIGKAWHQSTGARRTKMTTGPRTYSVPRRFGLATLFIITLAFGMLSAVLQWAHFPPIAVGMVLAFVALVGVLQVVFDQAPRHASMIAGSLWFSISALIVLVAQDPNYATLTLSTQVFYAACWALLGMGIGYCTGTFVGGVFLITDSIDGFLWGSPKPVVVQASEVSTEALQKTEMPVADTARDPNYPYYARVNSAQRSSSC